MADVIDLRSDTVTKPTQAMRQAMACAEVGDDVFGEDPTVAALETRVASMLDKEAALFFPSATMSNLAACLAHCHEGRMNEVVLGSDAHMALFEVGHLSTVGSIFARQVENLPDGTMDLKKLHQRVMPHDVHCTTPKLICIENTNCHLGGKVLPLSFIDGVKRIADDAVEPKRAFPVAMHCDGARLWNAATAAAERPELLGLAAGSTVSVHQALLQYARPFNSISVCLSKGLGAPVGSVLAADAALIGRARHVRKMLGGSMRQAGIIAAGGLYALEHHLERLRDDHANARRLAERLRKEEPRITVIEPSSNMVLFKILQEDGTFANKAPDFQAALEEASLRISYEDWDTCRIVANLGVDSDGFDRAVDIIVKTFRNWVSSS